MRIGRSTSTAGKTQVVVLTADKGFEDQVRLTFGASEQIVLRVITGTLAGMDGDLDLEGATVAVVDLDASRAGRNAGARAPDGARRHLAAGRRAHPGFR